MSIFIVAEIGINHNGDMSICKELIDIASESGCNAVKFQKRDINKVYTQDFLNSYRESPWGTTQRDPPPSRHRPKTVTIRCLVVS